MDKIENYIETYFPWLMGELLDIPLWVFASLPLILIFSIFIAHLIAGFILTVLRISFSRLRSGQDKADLSSVKGPLSLFLSGLIFSAISKVLPLGEGIEKVTSGIAMIFTAVGICWATIRIITASGTRLRASLISHGKIGAAAIVPLLDKVLKVTVFVIAFLFILQNFGFDVVAIITALGIGGIAIALASQRSVENVFGGAMITLDQPVRVGDFFKWNDQVGTVEDIGLRSTKIRTLDRTIVAIPNAELANIQLENFAARDKIRLFTVIGLRYETTPAQLRIIISNIRKLLLGHPKVENDPARARFVAFNDYSLDIEIFAYVKTPDWGYFLEIREDIFLAIMEIIHEAGSDFAFPSQTVYFERGAPLAKEKQDRAQQIISEGRQMNRLDWPDLPPERKNEITDKLEYPASLHD